MTTKSDALPRPLVVGVLGLTLVVLVLGGAVLAVRLRPQTGPLTTTERALQAWQDAVAEEPENDANQTGLGLALLQADRDGEARAAFQEALRLNPKNWMANFQLGLLTTETDPDRALELLLLGAKYAPLSDKAAPFIAAGDLQMAQEDFEGAKDSYRRSIAAASYIFEGHLGLAKALEALGDNEGALEEYREAARFAPDHPDVVAAIDRLEGTR